jgi:hypothetical protein
VRTRQLAGPRYLACFSTANAADNVFTQAQRARILEDFDPISSVFLVDRRPISLLRVYREATGQRDFYHQVLTPLIHYHLPELLVQLGRADDHLTDQDERLRIQEERDNRLRPQIFNSVPRKFQLLWLQTQGQAPYWGFGSLWRQPSELHPSFRRLSERLAAEGFQPPILLAPNPFPSLLAPNRLRQIPLAPNRLRQIPLARTIWRQISLAPNLSRQIPLAPNLQRPSAASLAADPSPISLRQILVAIIESPQELDQAERNQAAALGRPLQLDLSILLPPSTTHTLLRGGPFCQLVTVTPSTTEAPHLTSSRPPSPEIKTEQEPPF